MSAPPWLAAVLAAVMIAVAGYCVARLISAWRWRRPTELDADGTHAVMGVAMAGMLAAGLRTLPAGVWAVVFGVAAVWFGGQAVRAQRGVAASPWRCPHPLPHVVETGAMVYMLLAVRGARPGPGSRGTGSAMGVPGAAGHLPVLALALALFIIGYVMWVGDRLTRPGGPLPEAALPEAARPAAAAGPAAAGPGAAAVAALAPFAPRTVACCKIAMGVTMGYMLIVMM
jgi:Domain of unknown function (DUF5134)